jgi:hypothetical protein
MVKRLVWVLGGGALALLALGALLWLNLPLVVEKSIGYLVAGALPGQPFSCTVRRVGISGVELEAIVLGNPEKPALRIDSLQLDYSLRDLFSRHVERLALEGLVVQGEWRDGRFALEGFPIKAAEADFSLPGTIGQFSINNGLLRGGVHGRMEQLPFRLHFAQEKLPGVKGVIAPLSGSLSLYPEGRELALVLTAGVAEGVLNFKVDAGDFPLASLAGVLGQDLEGVLQFAAEGRLGLNPFAVRSLDLHCAIERFVLRGKDNSWLVNAAGAEKEPSFLFSLSVAEEKFHFTSNGLVVHAPVELTVADLVGAGVLAGDGGGGSGSLLLSMRPAGQKEEGIRTKGTFEAGFSQQSGWDFSLKGVSQAVKKARSPVALKGFRLELKKVPSAALRLSANISGLALHQDKGGDLLLPETRIVALIPEDGLGERGRAELHVPEMTVQDGETELRITGLAATLPLSGDEKKGAEAGKVHLARIRLDGQDLGGLELRTEHRAGGVSFVGSHISKALEGVTVQVKGEVSSSTESGLHGSLQLSAPRQKFTGFNLGRFVKEKQEITLAGEFGLQVAGAFKKGVQSVNLHLQLDNTRLDLPQRDIAVSGLSLSLAMPDFFQKKSLPAQPLAFAAAKVGDLVLADGEIAFQIESPTVLLLDSGNFAWCEGRVSSQPLRLSTDRNDYELTLLCDRLSLPCLLAQFGMEGAEGEGILNGKIPLSVTDGKVRFIDGILNSPPGEGGTIRFGDVGLLTAGIPKESPQFSQLDFAGAALKNFRYNSANLRLHSEGDELLLQIKLDGQPGQPIPFKYDGRIGGFTRLREGETGGITHPILLDMNLRVPFEKILQYGGGMQKLYKMTQ